MSSSSPSEFLTFYRRAASASSQVLRASTRTHLRTTPPVSIRQYAIPARDDRAKDDEHTTRKKDKLDVQSANAKDAMDAHKSGTGGHATERKDSAGGAKKAKKDHPEAPDPAIGMQDERGGRGA